MTTEWFNNDGSGVSVHLEDPNLALIGDYIPDWIMIPPDSPALPGEKLRVTGHTFRMCPMCKAKRVRVLVLQHDFRVAECKPGCGFVFYKVEPEPESVDNPRPSDITKGEP